MLKNKMITKCGEEAYVAPVSAEVAVESGAPIAQASNTESIGRDPNNYGWF